MSKGTRKREAAAQRREQELQEQQRRQSARRRRNRILIPVVAVAAAVVVLGGALFLHYRRINSPDYIQHHTAAISSDNFRVTQAMMTYFINSAALNFAQQNANSLNTLGLDTDRPLSSQPCYFDSSISWFEYFAATAENSVQWMLAFAEKGKEEGITLTDTEKTEIEETLARIDPAVFGAYVTTEDIRACMELYYIAARQEEATLKSLTASDEDIRAYADAHEQELQLSAYAYYTIAHGEKDPYEDDAAEELANKLLGAASVEEFGTMVEEEFVSRGLYTAETVVENRGIYRVRSHPYTAGSKLDEWLFGGDVEVGDTFRVDEEDEITVYQCLEVPARSTAPAVDVRHILITPSTAGSDAAAENRAQQVLAEWKEGAATEETFSLLAVAYSEDGNAADGGLYAVVTEGMMVDTFNDWCFEKIRQPGDTGIVKTDYGYHVMYFVGSGEEWYMNARELYLDEQYDAIYRDCMETYHVTVHEDAVDGLNI